ncbi:MAG: hypothetical protein IPN50_09665 [Sphingomonadales bacterium]|uniref:hypothetical protein n=1 Tax=Sphingorhabdus sp. TaxID=1902408 RepID=UPI003BB1A608|nr:hypothetical protein [Sphingomonadales bacterium]
MSAALLFLLLATVNPHVEVIEDNRFKISAVIINPNSPTDHYNAQMGIALKAKQVCIALNRGPAVSEGTLHLDNLPPVKGKKKSALQVSEFYSCQLLSPVPKI